MTARAKQPLRTLGEHYELAYAHGLSGLCGLEQAMYQSMNRKVCVRCLSPDKLRLVTGRALIKSTDYYMCAECDQKYAANRIFK